ncbi:hypothetical protein GCM10011584_05430 [Nocardioides phosphati]|uniref:DUF2933 domain-containing protein n=1 Tax=Nocardioides phosphati TaxID=1867775 RepID=A0ABQ2N5M8_9ACTN|nr:hypothetical protein [Nocardioides phosphati]GGO85445.1 hypothetical protein GCM10011584_05430 [Nocardioides phosphati]
MEQLFYAVAVLACPVGMGLMMFFMMRPRHTAPAASGGQDELSRLRAEVDQLKSVQRDRSAADSEPL